MNEFYEAVSNLFEELRCDSGEREYTVQPEEWKEAEKNLKQIQKKLPLHLEKIPEREQNFWNKYLDQLEHFHYEEEQRAYYQGMMDVVKVLKPEESVYRELILVKIRANAQQRSEIVSIVDIFRAKIVDAERESLVIELTGTQSKLEAFLQLLDGYEILELARTGIAGLSRGIKDVTFIE